MLGDHEEVHINVAGPAMEADVRRLLADEGADSGNVFFHHNPTNDAWCRDHGPIFVQRQDGGRTEEAILDWGYNAWGGKYPPYDLDDVVPSRIGREFGIPVHHPGMILEGGSIDVNGKGTLLTTEACLLNPNRNPQLDRAAIEDSLRRHLGVSHILWLGDGIVGDDTDGHVDDLTRFVDPTGVVTVVEEDPADENYEPLQENLERLRAMRDQDGNPAPGGHAADAPPDVPGRPAAAGELRQLLHRQRCGPAADVRPRARLRSPGDPPGLSSPAARWSGSTAPTWSGAWAPSTA